MNSPYDLLRKGWLEPGAYPLEAPPAGADRLTWDDGDQILWDDGDVMTWD